MKLIPLTQGKFAKVDDADFESLSKYNWQAIKKGRVWYAQRRGPFGKTLIKMHRQITGAGIRQKVDHEDSDGLNNQRRNMRVCTHQQNCCNQRKQLRKTSSRFKGVWWSKAAGKWQAGLHTRGNGIYLGLFKTQTAAARAYDAASEKHFGVFARLNFP